jgi:hypothetical protein
MVIDAALAVEGDDVILHRRHQKREFIEVPVEAELSEPPLE